MNEQELKLDLNNQMLSYMVSENHQKKLNVIIFPYFLSVNMKDPVVYNHGIHHITTVSSYHHKSPSPHGWDYHLFTSNFQSNQNIFSIQAKCKKKAKDNIL